MAQALCRSGRDRRGPAAGVSGQKYEKNTVSVRRAPKNRGTTRKQPIRQAAPPPFRRSRTQSVAATAREGGAAAKHRQGGIVRSIGQRPAACGTGTADLDAPVRRIGKKRTRFRNAHTHDGDTLTDRDAGPSGRTYRANTESYTVHTGERSEGEKQKAQQARRNSTSRVKGRRKITAQTPDVT